MIEKFLELEIRLLILRHGKNKILKVLAHIGEQSAEELNNDIRKIERKPGDKHKRTQAFASDLIDPEIVKTTEAKSLIRILMSKYSNNIFLPQLKDALRFIERTGLDRGTIKTRRGATKTVIKALSMLSLVELSKLVDDSKGSKENDFSILARTLMGEPKENPENNTDQEHKANKD